MEPDEVTDGDTAAEVTLVLEDETGDETPTVDAGDTTVIVAPAIDPDTAPELDPFTERFVKLESRMDAIESTAYEAKWTAEDADMKADEALDDVDALAANDVAILDATDEAIVESIEGADIEKGDDGDLEATVDDIAPASSKVHPLFRSMKDWRS